MFPMSTFVAWSSQLNDTTDVLPYSEIKLSQQMVFGMQDITVSFQDRAMVSYITRKKALVIFKMKTSFY